MKIVAFTNQKGGVGKTNTTVNLAVGLARMGKKVLIVDTDPQGDATKSLGFDTPDAIPHTLATLMETSRSPRRTTPKPSYIMLKALTSSLPTSTFPQSKFRWSTP